MPAAPTNAESSACSLMQSEYTAQLAPRLAPRASVFDPSQSLTPSGFLAAEKRTPHDPPTAMHRFLPPCPACPQSPSACQLTHTHTNSLTDRNRAHSVCLWVTHLSHLLPLYLTLTHSTQICLTLILSLLSSKQTPVQIVTKSTQLVSALSASQCNDCLMKQGSVDLTFQL